MAIEFIRPDWPAPRIVRAAVTTRHGGVSLGAYRALNIASHVGDRDAAVLENRSRMATQLGLASEPLWLEQVHGATVVILDQDGNRVGDAALTRRPGRVAAVMTADCLPVLLCSRDGSQVAAVHGGWRGLAAGVLEATVAAMAQPDQLLAWLGPAISQMAYEVDGPVRDRFLDLDPGHEACFIANGRGRWQANLYALARRILKATGVAAIYGGGFCTYYDQRRFFSHRRDGPCGRMASLIWLKGPH